MDVDICYSMELIDKLGDYDGLLEIIKCKAAVATGHPDRVKTDRGDRDCKTICRSVVGIPGTKQLWVFVQDIFKEFGEVTNIRLGDDTQNISKVKHDYYIRIHDTIGSRTQP